MQGLARSEEGASQPRTLDCVVESTSNFLSPQPEFVMSNMGDSKGR